MRDAQRFMSHRGHKRTLDLKTCCLAPQKINSTQAEGSWQCFKSLQDLQRMPGRVGGFGHIYMLLFIPLSHQPGFSSNLKQMTFSFMHEFSNFIFRGQSFMLRPPWPPGVYMWTVPHGRVDRGWRCSSVGIHWGRTVGRRRAPVPPSPVQTEATRPWSALRTSGSALYRPGGGGGWISCGAYIR